jgi:hypothetical protein
MKLPISEGDGDCALSGLILMSEVEPRASRVFSSSSQESDYHVARVVGLADALTSDGRDVVLDRSETAPNEGWPL